MKALIHFKHLLCKALEYAVIFTLILMVTVACWQIVLGWCSKIFTIPIVLTAWNLEALEILIVWSAFLGAAVGFARKCHLGIDFLVSKFDETTKSFCAVIAYLISIAFVSIVIVKGGWALFQSTDEILPGFKAAGIEFNVAYTYLAFPLSGCFMLLFLLEGVFELFMSNDAIEQDTMEESNDIALDVGEI